MKKQISIVLILVLGLLLSWSVRAEEGVAGPVPWVSDIQGGEDSLLIKQQDTDWFEATVNTPVGQGDMLWQKPGGHSEVYFEDGSWVRLGGNTGVEFIELRDGRVRLVQTRGNALLQNNGQGGLLVDLPGQTMSMPPGSRAKVNVEEDGRTRVTVKKGRAFVEGPRGQVRVDAGQSLRADADGNIAELTRNVPAEGLDSYSQRRNRELGQAGGPPTTTVSYLPDPVVYQMSSHGTWVNSPGYGWVWRPRVSADWAPYRTGRWMYRTGWGWTWISYEPWGWYPYHYGRWVVVNNHWVWTPVRVRGRWHPSLVFWVEGPDYIAWHPIPYGVSVSVVHTWGPSMAYRYIHHRGVTMIHHRHFRSCNYYRYARPWRGVSHRSIRVIHHPHHAHHHPISVRYNYTPRTRGYLDKNRSPNTRVIYAHNKRASRGKDTRVSYGNQRSGRNSANYDRNTARSGSDRHATKGPRHESVRPNTPRSGNRADAGRIRGSTYGHDRSGKSAGRGSPARTSSKGDSRRAVNSGHRSSHEKSVDRPSSDRAIKYGAPHGNKRSGKVNRPNTGGNRSDRAIKAPGRDSSHRTYKAPSNSRHKSYHSPSNRSYNRSGSRDSGTKSRSVFSGKSRSSSSHGDSSFRSPSRKSSKGHSSHRSGSSKSRSRSNSSHGKRR